MVPVFSCAKHGECTLWRAKQLTETASCVGCETREPPAQAVASPERFNPIHRLEPLPYTGEVRRHLIYHLWPVQNENWKRNLDQLLPHLEVFNGRRQMGIVTDARSETAETVMRYIEDRVGADHRIDFLLKSNHPRLGEVVTFSEMLAGIQTDSPNDIYAYMHGKAVRKDGHPTCLRWGELMYGAMLSNVPEVERILESHVFAGSFRRYGPFFRNICRFRWHYSGTFHWGRCHWVFQRDWKQVHKRYWGVEAWPGRIARYEESACLYGDNVGNLYKEREFEPLWEQFPAWREEFKCRSRS